MKNTLALLLSLFALAAQAIISQQDFPTAIEITSAPREVLQAVNVRASVKENQLTSDLNGKTKGYLLIDVVAETRGKFHLYDDKFLIWSNFPNSLADKNAEAWPVEVIQKPEPHQFLDPITKGLRSGFQGEAHFLVKAHLPKAISQPLDKSFKLPLVVGFQACSDKVCLLPVALRVMVAMSDITEESPPLLMKRFQNAVAGQLGTGGLSLTTALVLILAGLITAFTPCVYPLYPITLGLFSRWSSQAHISSLLLALVYSVGMVLSYSVLGLVSVATGSLFGSLTQTPLFLISMGIFILASALIFSGAVNFPLFDRLQGLFSKPMAQSQKPIVVLGHALFMGASLGIVASPCVGPVLVVILAWVGSQTQAMSSAYLMGFSYLALFGAGMALPFLVMGHLILRMGKHPKLGKYTPYFKNIGTVMMVAASLFFLVPGIELLKNSSSNKKVDFEVQALSTWARDKPTVIDFRADWCVACVELENDTFSHPQVAAKFKNKEWDFVRVDLTQLTPETQKIATEYGVVGLPTVLLFDGNGRACPSLRLVGFEGPQEFQTRMRQAMQGCR